MLVLMHIITSSLWYRLYILVSTPRVAISNVTTKQVTLITSNPWMLGDRDP